jgi:hypothetical protein
MPLSSKNCREFALSNKINSSKMLFGLVCQNVFGTDCVDCLIVGCLTANVKYFKAIFMVESKFANV